MILRREPADMNNWMYESRITVVTGHLGSGKTEFALNLALKLSSAGFSAALADLDVVNPYFRSREQKEFLEAHKIRLISAPDACVDADVPSMPPDVRILFDNPRLWGILDIGGDASGSRVLARYRENLRSCEAKMLFVINGNRPMTCTPSGIIDFIKGIEETSGLAVEGLVNNTHFFERTEPEDIMRGAELAGEVSRLSGVPVICHMVPEGAAFQSLPDIAPLFPVHLYMKKPWDKIPAEQEF